MKRKPRSLAVWLFAVLTAGLILCETGQIALVENPKQAFGLAMCCLMLLAGRRVAASAQPWWRQ
jgi:hypothetical protein